MYARVRHGRDRRMRHDVSMVIAGLDPAIHEALQQVQR